MVATVDTYFDQVLAEGVGCHLETRAASSFTGRGLSRFSPAKATTIFRWKEEAIITKLVDEGPVQQDLFSLVCV